MLVLLTDPMYVTLEEDTEASLLFLSLPGVVSSLFCAEVSREL